MRDGVCLRASQGAKDETPPSRSLQSSEGMTASDKSRRSLPLFPPCATCGGWRALIFHPERERKPRGVKSDGRGGGEKEKRWSGPTKTLHKCPLNYVSVCFAVLYLSAVFLCRKQGHAATAVFFCFVCSLCVRQVNCVFAEWYEVIV